MRLMLLSAVVALIVTPALAVEGPTPATYSTLAGDFSEGHFSESWVDPPYNDGVVHNTIHAWDNGQGVEWRVYCPWLLNVTVNFDTRDQNGNGFVQYETDYSGGTMWLSKWGPWGHAPDPDAIDFTATITMFKVTSTHQYSGGVPVNIVSDILLYGQFDPPVEEQQCFEYALSNGEITGNTAVGMTLPAGYPPFLDYYDCPGGTVTQGAWGDATDISITIYGTCTIPTETSTWGKIKSLYSE
ncbi:MAG: hypothetical protein JSW50_10765 [Candidatus Latescibacterota bacterium]|nr:MAG: hypothetical protein JSW50_10765 [Candidatus Latescibacterota bacterium]